MRHIGRATGLALTSLLLSSVAVWAGPKIVSGPGANAHPFRELRSYGTPVYMPSHFFTTYNAPIPAFSHSVL